MKCLKLHDCFLRLHFFHRKRFLRVFLSAYKGSVFYVSYFKLFWPVGTTHAQATTFPFFEKRESLSVGKNRKSLQHNTMVNVNVPTCFCKYFFYLVQFTGETKVAV